jgi:hypothetical protein
MITSKDGGETFSVPSFISQSAGKDFPLWLLIFQLPNLKPGFIGLLHRRKKS